MPDFIFRANIAHYENLLVTETDAKKIAVIRKMLADVPQTGMNVRYRLADVPEYERHRLLFRNLPGLLQDAFRS